MATDNWPVEFHYISRRLVREIVDQHSAARRGRFLKKLSVSLPGAGISAEFAGGTTDMNNLFQLARQATDAVADLTGDLISPGTYIRATLDFTWDAIPVLTGWDGAQNVRIASFFADAKVADIGGVFLGLFGSASNFLGMKPAEYQGDWMPSGICQVK